jgi:plasmid stabilization system protein ParE
MELRWTTEAADDLERIADYLFEHAPAHLDGLVRQIYEAPSALLKFPHAGGRARRMGRENWCSHPRLTSWVYRIAGGAIHIVRILHGAQKWP